MFLGSSHQVDGQVTPFVIPRSHNASVSQTLITETTPSPGVAQHSSKFVASSNASPYTHSSEVTLSRPLLEANSNEYSSSAGRPAPGAGIEPVAAEVVSGAGGAVPSGMHSPQSPVSDQHVLSDASFNGTSQWTHALPTPTSQHADSGIRFPVADQMEVAVLALGAPPAYTMD